MAESVTPKDDRIEEDVKRRFHPPSKKLHDQQIKVIDQNISSSELKLKSLKAQTSDNLSPSSTLERESHSQILRTLREDKENKMKKRKEIEEQLKVICSKINRKNDELSKKQARLPSKSTKNLESMIKRLQYQLERNHFSLREETRIVHEIDSLKRSMKTLREWLAEKEELDIEIAKKNRLRAHRDKIFKEVSGLRTEEDKVKRQLQEVRCQTNIEWSNLKKEIDELYHQKRKISANYQAEWHQFSERRAMYREQNERQRMIQKEARHHELKQKMKEQMADPFAYKLRDCNTLLNYLQRLFPSDIHDPSTHNATLGQDRSSTHMQTIQDVTSASHVQSSTSLSPSSSFNEDSGHVLPRKKNDEDEWMFAGNASRIKKKQAKMRNRKASWMNKSISHPPDIFPLFSELGLTAPSSGWDVADVVSQLQRAKLHFEQSSRKRRSDTGNTGIDSGTASSSECYSPSTADIVPNFKAHGNKPKIGTTESTHLVNDEDDDENDSVFDDTTENTLSVGDDDDSSFSQEGICIPPSSVKPGDEKPHLKLNIGPKNSYFETSKPLPKQNQSLLEAACSLDRYQDTGANNNQLVPQSDALSYEALTSLPDDKVLKLGTTLSTLNTSDICEIELRNFNKHEPVVPDMQQELHAEGDASL